MKLPKTMSKLRNSKFRKKTNKTNNKANSSLKSTVLSLWSLMRGGSLRKLVRFLLRGFFGFLAVFFSIVALLSVLWFFVPPVSTLMLSYWITGHSVARDAVPINDISPHLVLAVINSEDAKFCDHRGVDWNALTNVATTSGGPRRGASTITMQTVKNLYLWHDRSYIRKALEVPVAHFTDLVWSKRHVMEVYLNIAEWGDGIFGAEAAARHYFDKSAKNLNAREAALLATALPNPFLRNPRRPSAIHIRLANTLMGRMKNSQDVATCVLTQ